jgi:hypothetical protein
MENDQEKQRRKNMLVGWAIGILAVGLYAVSIFLK